MPSSKGRAASVSSAGSQAQSSPRSSVAPMSERQQLALLMQLTSEENPPEPKPPTPPPPEKKRSRKKRNNRGETPLHIAAIRGDHEQVKKILAQTRKPDVCDFAGWTPLHEACSYGWYQVVEVLVEGGANVNAKGLDDDTPLHDAATSGNLRMVQLLVEHGADPTAKNAKGKTPIDYASQEIYSYLVSVADSSARSTQVGRSRDDSSSGRKGNASEGGKGSVMEGLAQDQEAKEASPADKPVAENKDDGKVSSGVVSSSQDEGQKYYDEDAEDEGEVSKRKKRKENDDKEPMGKPAPVQRGGTGRVLTGTKPPGPASKTGAAPLGKGGAGQASKGSGSGSGKGGASAQKAGGKSGSQGVHQGKSSGGKGGGAASKGERKSPVSSPAAGDEHEEAAAPKVPPLKIVIPGGAAGSSSRIEQEGEGGGQRGGGKGGRGATLPYVIPCTADPGQGSDSSDASDDKRSVETKVHEEHAAPRDRSDSRHGSHELHPRKRKIKSSKESHSRDSTRERDQKETEHLPHSVAHSNPYQMYIHIRKQIDQRQKTLFPVKPKPPKDFNKYLMNRCTYTLQSTVAGEPPAEPPPGLPAAMRDEFAAQEKERHRLRIQHLVEKEKLVLAVEQEILRVHGRAERAVANQSLPFSVCTMLRDREVYNVLAPEQDEKRNAQRSRCNGRQINSWLQEVDDKWEKIKEGMLRRQHTEAETLHAVQTMGWEWKLKELGLCDYKTTPKIDPTHVPQIHVSNFDLPA